MTKRARGWCDGTDEVDRAIAAACDEDSVFKLRYAVGEIGGDDPCSEKIEIDRVLEQACLSFLAPPFASSLLGLR